MFQTITINASQEVQIDLSNATTGEVNISQLGNVDYLRGPLR